MGDAGTPSAKPSGSGAGLRNYAIVTAAYWGFTLTDGALRMLVLFTFFKLGYSPFTLAFLFLLYEAAGILANMIGGWLAARYGIKRMLIVGLSTQIAGFLILSLMNPGWEAAFLVTWVVLAQGICGVAKDLTKTASKSAIKLTEAEAKGSGEGRLFKWVAWFTGSKNAMKGAGFFLGGVLLEALGFSRALWLMAGALALVLVGVVLSLPALKGKAKASKSAKELFGKSRGVNLLALARIGLFGARDVWFVVGVPVFLYANGWTFTLVGAFLAIWTIGYGVVQASAPAVVRRSADGLSSEVPAARGWSLALLIVPLALAAGLSLAPPRPDLILVAGLCLFGVIFAVNSSVHSYLILAYAGSEKAAEDVGFYYAANAVGRFLGTLLSGLLYQWGGLHACLVGSGAMLLTCWIATQALPKKTTEPTAVA
jgi:MFS family permease